MERARHELLARAALARDEDRRGVTREATHLRGEPTHQDRAAGEAGQRRRERSVGEPRRIVDQCDAAERRAPHRDERPGADPRAPDARAADERAVLRAEVLDLDAAAEQRERTVPRAHRRIVDDQIGLRRRPDDQLFDERHPPAAAFVLQLQKPAARARRGLNALRRARLFFKHMHSRASSRPRSASADGGCAKARNAISCRRWAARCCCRRR